PLASAAIACPHSRIATRSRGGQGMAWRAIGAMLLASVACSVTVHAADLQSAQMRESDANALQIEIMPLLTSDYIYRGVSLSGRRPSVGTEIDVERSGFYVHTEFRSVKLPTQPAAEITLNGGYRFDGPWETNLDLGASYFYYPGEIPIGTTTKTNYWEYAFN